MTQEDENQLEAEARELFHCDKGMLNYLVKSGGSIGPSKITETENKKLD